uniref:Uncharacterized protein n=1 Tax=Salarias fasciatus TaxID=181472 RepID=A0A672GR48_SALFA
FKIYIPSNNAERGLGHFCESGWSGWSQTQGPDGFIALWDYELAEMKCILLGPFPTPLLMSMYFFVANLDTVFPLRLLCLLAVPLRLFMTAGEASEAWQAEVKGHSVHRTALLCRLTRSVWPALVLPPPSAGLPVSIRNTDRNT